MRPELVWRSLRAISCQNSHEIDEGLGQFFAMFDAIRQNAKCQSSRRRGCLFARGTIGHDAWKLLDHSEPSPVVFLVEFDWQSHWWAPHRREKLIVTG